MDFFSVKKKSRCWCVQEDWDSESDCCMFGVWMFHRRNADRLLEVCASDVFCLTRHGIRSKRHGVGKA